MSPEELKSKLNQLDQELADLKARWPAHSVKPVHLQQLEELEEEIQLIRQLLDK